MNKNMKNVKELNIGDVVRTEGIAFGTAVVKNKKEDRITFFRPYVHTANFKYTGGVICHIGIEEYDVSLSGNYVYELIEESRLKD